MQMQNIVKRFDAIDSSNIIYLAILSVLIVFVLTVSFLHDSCLMCTFYLTTACFSISGQHPDPCYLRDVWVPAAEARPPARPPAQLPPLHSSLGPRRPSHPTLHPLRVQVSNR